MTRPLALFVLLAACETGSGSDAMRLDGDVACVTSLDCTDGVFCNGLEVCSPEGCAPGTPPCGDAACSEDGAGCEGCAPADADGDGHDAAACGGDDCDDADALRAPSLAEVCDVLARDEDCDEATLGAADLDGDGALDAACCNGARCGEDCDDTSALIGPSSPERCDGLDGDCDGRIDEGLTLELFEDVDGDGFGTEVARSLCEPVDSFRALRSGDCDDTDPLVHPLVTERCDGRDEDCSGLPDDGAASASCLGVGVLDATCSAGRCVINTCEPGVDDCNDDPSDGCERSLGAVTDCGACGHRCDDPFGTAACLGGVCDVVDCSWGRHRCGRACVPDDIHACGVDCEVCPPPPRLGTAVCERGPFADPLPRCRVRCNFGATPVDGPDGTRCEWSVPNITDLDVEDATTTAMVNGATGWVAWVPRDVTARRVLVRMAAEAVVTLTIGGVPVTPNVASEPIPLALGENFFTVEVVAEHGERRTSELRITRGWDDWHYLKTDAPSPEAELGSALAATDAWIVAGAPSDDVVAVDAGRALIYAPTPSGFRFVQALTAPNAGAGDHFGASVAIDGDVIVVGAPGEASAGAPDDDTVPGAGAAYAYRWNGSAFVFESYLKATAASAAAGFGSTVAVDGNVAVVAAPGEGALYVLERSGAWSLVHRHVLAGGGATVGVSVDGSRIAVAAGNQLEVLTRTTSWTAEPAMTLASWQADSISLEGDMLVVGSSGSVHVYERGPTAWSAIADLSAYPVSDFGESVAITPEGILIGGTWDHSEFRGAGGHHTGISGAREAGAAFLFRRTASGWVRAVYLKAPSPGTSDRFGAAVAWCNGYAIIGAPGEDGASLGVDESMASEGSLDAGAIYAVAP